jgi:pilus assembly protein CpaF
MTSEPMMPEQDPSNPTALPPLFSAPPSRPGRVRGGFSMRPGAQPSDPVLLDAVRRRHAATTPVPSTAPRQFTDHEDLDWGLVAAFRTLVANRLAAAMGEDWRTRAAGQADVAASARIPMDRAAQEQEGWRAIEDLLSEHTADAVATGAEAWSPRQRAAMAQAIFDAVFRLGRLQPLVDDDRVENIFILGCRQVLLELTDGTRIPGPAVAESDEELIDFLRFLANRSESNPRPFSEGTPRLHMKLDGGARLAATSWVVSRPTVVIRRHRLKIDSLEAWVDRGCLSPASANLLGAAVRAGWSIVVSGAMSAGKTTLMRALCAEIPREEAIGTFETEYELFLGESGHHEIVIDWESRPGVGEIGADGRAAGAFDLGEALNDSFRFALSRQIVGEIRGPETWTMIKAMESGTGSLSTTHAADANACIRKLVTCAMEAGNHVTRDLALEKLVGCLNLIVQLNRRVVTLPDGTQQLRRWVSEVVLVEPGEREIGYALEHLCGPSMDGPAQASGILPPQVMALAEYGFNPDLFQSEADAGGWTS